MDDKTVEDAMYGASVALDFVVHLAILNLCQKYTEEEITFTLDIIKMRMREAYGSRGAESLERYRGIVSEIKKNLLDAGT